MKLNLSKYLTRKSYSTNFIPEIDGLRFLAIITVVIFHLQTHFFRITNVNYKFEGINEYIHYMISRGGLGVNVFFGISGFILALPFAKKYFNNKKIALKSYFIRRLTRLEPPYIISLTILLIAQIIYFNSSFQELQTHFFASLLYIHFFIYGSWSTINPVAWSLETEVQFYIIAPLLFLIFKNNKIKFRFLLFTSLIILSSLLTFFFKPWLIEYHLHKSILVYLPFFLLGILFAEFYIIKQQSIKNSKNYYWDLLGLIATIGLFVFHNNNNNLLDLIQLFMMFIVFYTAFKGKLLNWFYTRKIIYIIGGMCYSIYLIHYALISILIKYTSKLSFSNGYLSNIFLQIIIVIPIVFLASAIFFMFFEKPFMYRDWPKQFIKYLSFNKNKT